MLATLAAAALLNLAAVALLWRRRAASASH
jgi:hypothetical protein